MIEKKYYVLFMSVVKVFKKAESKIKEIELYNSEIVIPSLNELRYVGYHITHAGSSKDDQVIKDELKKAKQHAERAIYDAIEAGLLYKLEEIKEFHNKFDNIPQTTQIVSDYLDKISRVQSILDDITLISKETREEKYEEIEKYYKEIVDISRVFQ